jgi:hypothetical protein
MAAGVSLAKACSVIGHKKATSTGDLILGLDLLGIKCALRLKRVSTKRPHYPKRCILHVAKETADNYGHWILLWDGVEYDPAGYTIQEYRGWKVLSYLEIYA